MSRIKKTFQYLRRSLLLRYGAVYFVGVLISLPVISMLIDTEIISAVFGEHLLFVLIFLGVGMSQLVLALERLSKEDQKLFSYGYLKLYGPAAVWVVCLYLIPVDYLKNTGVPPWLGLGLMLVAIFLLGVVWPLLYLPFFRRSLCTSASDIQSVQKALDITHWPLKNQSIRSVEIDINPKLYYSFAAGMAAITFIIMETTLSEVLSDVLGWSSYFSASVLAIGIAGIVLPIHNRAKRYLSGSAAYERDEGATDIRAAILAISTSFTNLGGLMKRHWVSLTVLLILIVVLSELFFHFAGTILGSQESGH